jgi:sec-independent protein translocase protein TatA
MSSTVLAQIMGPDGLIVVGVLLVVLLFGGSRLPSLARSLGSASHEFKRGISEGDHDEKQAAGAKHADAEPAITERAAS